MKLSDLHESTVVSLDASKLIKQAESAGQKLFAKDRSGLVFTPSIEVMTLADYASSDAGKMYDTYDYLFNPIKDVADHEIKDADAVDGIYYIAGASGVKIVTSPGVKVQLTNLPNKKKPEGDGATWVVYDKAGYDYLIEPRRGQPPLPEDPDEALKMIKSDSRFGIRNPDRIEKLK